jgi:catechol 2,3-dioxygenase-like lactoylglutathione lyase family enzyme
MAPPVQSLQHWTLVTNDLERSKRFYIDVLGASAINREFPPGVVFGGTTIDLFPANEEQCPEPGSQGQHHAYSIRLEDFDPWIKHLGNHDVPYFLGSHSRHISIYLEDPDGYHFELLVRFNSREEAQAEIAKRGIKSYRNPAGSVPA